jgi:hypothetical protein
MNRVFFPQTALDAWLSDGTVDLRGDELTITAEGRRYRLSEAVRIDREVTGGEDGNNFVGRVKQKTLLEATGAELLESSLILGDNAYDVVPGWLGEPVGSFDEHLAAQKNTISSKRPPPENDPQTDEDLLATYLLKNL